MKKIKKYPVNGTDHLVLVQAVVGVSELIFLVYVDISVIERF